MEDVKRGSEKRDYQSVGTRKKLVKIGKKFTKQSFFPLKFAEKVQIQKVLTAKSMDPPALARHVLYQCKKDKIQIL